VDEKGRLKLPSVFAQYLDKLNVRTVFITSLDGITIRIYPLDVWKKVEELFEQPQEDPEGAEQVWRTFNYWGADCDIDVQNRVLIPERLRRKAGFASKEVSVLFNKGRIDVTGAEEDAAYVNGASSTVMAKARELEKKGLR
jgi:MraZ protein